MINVSIAGGTGYTAGELLRILLRHPEVNIESVISTTSAGTAVAMSMHRDLLGETDLLFSDRFINPDVIFLGLGHGLSRSSCRNAIPVMQSLISVMTSGNEPTFGNRKFVFGLCELNREQIRQAGNVANPGCFAIRIIRTQFVGCENMLRDEVHVHRDHRLRKLRWQKPVAQPFQLSRQRKYSAYKPL